MPVYTAQYRYAGFDRLDITVKGKHPVGKVLAPTWDLVINLNNGRITRDEYTSRYVALLYQRLQHTDAALFNFIIKRAMMADITFVCFCPPDTFCHRVIVAQLFHSQFGIAYNGERRL